MEHGATQRARHELQAGTDGERLVIVGTGEWGATAHEYFGYDSPHEVVAFSAEAPFIESETFRGLPVVPLDELARAYPPREYRAFVAVSGTRLGRVRRRLYGEVKAAGYRCVSYISSHAFALPSVEVGENVFVQENAALEIHTRIGDNVFIGCGVCIGHSSVVADDCTIGPHAAICGYVSVGRGTFVGAKSCITDCVTIADDCIIGAGAIVLRDTKPRQVYVGNPARPTARDSFETFGVDLAGAGTGRPRSVTRG